MKVKEALQRFFEEKELEQRTFPVKHNGTVHMVESDFLQDIIINHTPDEEQEQIWKIIAQIDYRNGDINHFLEHLAKSYIKTNF